MEEQNKVKDMLGDKAFSHLLLMSFLGIFVCIICLCSTTFAWFSDGAPSLRNEITMADDCLLSVVVSCEGAVLTGIEDGVQLEVGKCYEVILTLPPNTASGYCLLTAGGVNYYTDYISRHTEETEKTVTFTLTVATTQMVKFTTRWGIYAAESSIQNGQLQIP